ncbi:MAG: type secretion protein [Noviherbaspirillum sp.]|nr:type secretion protein [Noviherbaspirillum sp.]
MKDYMKTLSDSPRTPVKHADLDLWLSCMARVLMVALTVLPHVAYAQSAGGAFGGITDFLKSITNLLIFEWGYYIGIITLGIQGYRWKTGRIDMMQLGGWGLGIALVFFAPQIVADLRNRAGGMV